MNKLFSKSLLVIGSFAYLMVCTSTYASALTNEENAWKAFRDGKAVAVMRHAFAPPGEDNSALTRDICKGERNLSQEGRDQAVYLGEAIRAKGITNAKVYSSPVCRCLDTGILLGFDGATIMPAINTFYGDVDQKAKGIKQTADLNAWIKQAIEQQNTSNILVTHGFNISTMNGDFVDEGDFLLIGLVDGELVTLATIIAEDL